MTTIHKFTLQITDRQELRIPEGARFLSIQNQNGMLCMWAIVDTEVETTIVDIAIIGTGNPCWCHEWYFLGSVQMAPFVWHIFMDRQP